MNNILDSIKDIQELNQHLNENLNENLKSEYVMKKLTNKDKNLVIEHFLGLDEISRYNRFCISFNEYSIRNYVEKIDYDKNGIFGLFDNDLNMIGLGECVIYEQKEGHVKEAEVAFSVKKELQGQGLGNRLMKRLVRFAKMNDMKKLQMYCLRSNQASVHLAKKYGLKISFDGTESSAEVSFNEREYFKEIVEEQVDNLIEQTIVSTRRNIKTMNETQNAFNSLLSNIIKIYFNPKTNVGKTKRLSKINQENKKTKFF